MAALDREIDTKIAEFESAGKPLVPAWLVKAILDDHSGGTKVMTDIMSHGRVPGGHRVEPRSLNCTTRNAIVRSAENP